MRGKSRQTPEDRQIARIYYDRCSGMQISVMRIPALFNEARLRLRAGHSEQTIGDWMVEFLEAEKP
jgi:hypothetical protein